MNRLILVLFILLISSTSYAQWQYVDSLASPRDGMSSVIVDDVVYLIGSEYWSRDYPMPAITGEVLRFDLQTNQWLEPMAPLNYPRFASTAVVLNGDIYVFGGGSLDSIIVSQIEVCRLSQMPPDVARWEVIPDLSFSRYGASASVLNDTIIVTGGFSWQDQWMPDVSMYVTNPNFLGLMEVSSDNSLYLPYNVSHHVSFCLNDQLYLYGGFTEFGPIGLLSRLTNDGWEIVDSTITGLAAMAATTIQIWNPDLEMREEFALISGGSNQDGQSVSNMFLLDGNGEQHDFTLEGIDINLTGNGRCYHAMNSYFSTDTTMSVFIAGGSYRIFDFPAYFYQDAMILSFELPMNPVPEERETPLPCQLTLSSFPNPANGSMRITYNADMNGEAISLSLYNILGENLRNWTAVPGAGEQFIEWDGTASGIPVSAGVYFLTIMQGNQQQAIKLCRLP